MFSLQHDKLYFNLVSIEVESKDFRMCCEMRNSNQILLIYFNFFSVCRISCIYLYPRSPKGERGILFYLCPSKIFFVKFFSVAVDGRNVIFGHKRHICIPYCG